MIASLILFLTPQALSLDYPSTLMAMNKAWEPATQALGTVYPRSYGKVGEHVLAGAMLDVGVIYGADITRKIIRKKLPFESRKGMYSGLLLAAVVATTDLGLRALVTLDDRDPGFSPLANLTVKGVQVGGQALVNSLVLGEGQ